MTSSYALRLVCLSLAVLFLVHLAVGLAVAMWAPAVERRAERWRAAAAARMILALRLLPAAMALFVVFAICIPSYLRLEPEAMEEEIGFACLGLAVLGAVTWALSIARTAGAVIRSILYVRRSRRRASETNICESRVWITDGAERTLALAGIFHPRLIVSRELVEALPSDQLAAALRHESAHADAWDNFKRLVVMLTPNLPLQGRLNRAWARFTEWSADDRASEGDPNRPVSLAAALVSVARMGPASVPPLATALMANAGDLQIRVERLLREDAEIQPVPPALIAGCLLTAGGLLSLVLHPSTLSVAYQMLERLVD